MVSPQGRESDLERLESAQSIGHLGRVSYLGVVARRAGAWQAGFMSSSVVVTPRTHWFNGWFLRLFARPVVRFDGVDHAARWGRPLQIETAAGSHEVAVGARYRGTASILGVAESCIEVAEGQQVAAEARNGFFNHQPFTVTAPESARDPSA